MTPTMHTTISPFALVLSDTARMTLRHPATGATLTMPDGSAQWIELAGIDSPQLRKHVAQMQTSPAADADDPEAVLDRTVRLLAGCTVAWAIIGPDGEAMPPPTPETAADLYRRVSWLRAAADRHMLDRAAYLGNA